MPFYSHISTVCILPHVLSRLNPDTKKNAEKSIKNFNSMTV